MTLHPRRRMQRFQLGSVVWLTVVWVLLWGDLTFANVVAGILLALAVTRAMPLPPIDFHGRLHPGSLLYLIGHFLVEVVVASFQVATQALNPRRTPHGAVLAVPLRSHSDLYLTLTSELTSLVPGTIVVEAHRISGVLYVHVLDVETSGGIEAARQHVLQTEARILRALASDEELAEAGITRRRLRGPAHEGVAP